MSTERKDFRYRALVDQSGLAGYLRALADGLEQGDLRLAADNEEMQLTPRGLLQVRLRAARRGHRARLSVKMQWRERDDDEDRPHGTLHISPGGA